MPRNKKSIFAINGKLKKNDLTFHWTDTLSNKGQYSYKNDSLLDAYTFISNGY